MHFRTMYREVALKWDTGDQENFFDKGIGDFFGGQLILLETARRKKSV